MTDRNRAMIIVVTAAPAVSGFVRSFTDNCSRYLNNGWALSEKMQNTLDRLYAEATATSAPTEAAPTAPKLDGAGIDGIRQLFATATRNGAKRPGIKVQIEAMSIHLTRAGDESTNPGCIYVKVDGEYSGKILPAGDFRPMRTAPAALVPALVAFAADPAGIGAASGHATGACCFCSKSLNDPRSVTVGYGPDCATKYELPWGNETLPEAKPRRTRRRAEAVAA